MAEEKAKRVKKPCKDILKKKMKETKDIRVRIRLLILWQIYIIGKTVRETARVQRIHHNRHEMEETIRGIRVCRPC